MKDLKTIHESTPSIASYCTSIFSSLQWYFGKISRVSFSQASVRENSKLRTRCHIVRWWIRPRMTSDKSLKSYTRYRCLGWKMLDAVVCRNSKRFVRFWSREIVHRIYFEHCYIYSGNSLHSVFCLVHPVVFSYVMLCYVKQIPIKPKGKKEVEAKLF